MLIIRPLGIKSTWLTQRLSQKTLAINLPAEAIVRNVFGGGESACFHSFDACYDRGVKWCTEDSSHLVMRSRISWPSLSKRSFKSVQPSNLLCRSKAENCLGTQRALNFRKCKCSWIIVFTVPKERFFSCAISRQLMCRISRIRRSTRWMFPVMTAVGCEPTRPGSSLTDVHHLWKVYTIQMYYSDWASHLRTLLEVFCRYPRVLRLRSHEIHHHNLFHVRTNTVICHLD